MRSKVSSLFPSIFISSTKTKAEGIRNFYRTFSEEKRTAARNSKAAVAVFLSGQKRSRLNKNMPSENTGRRYGIRSIYLDKQASVSEN